MTHAGDALKRVGVPAGLVERVLGILTNPVQEWTRIAGEASTVADLYLKYAVLLALIPFASHLIGTMLLAMRFGYMSYVPWASLAVNLAIALAIQLGGLFVMALVMKALAPNFGAQPDEVQAMKVVVYASTPTWLLSVAYLLVFVPPLYRLAQLAVLLGGLYSIYLMWQGIGALLRPRPDQQAVYTIVSLVCFIVVMSIAEWFAGGVGAPGMMNHGQIVIGL